MVDFFSAMFFDTHGFMSLHPIFPEHFSKLQACYHLGIWGWLGDTGFVRGLLGYLRLETRDTPAPCAARGWAGRGAMGGCDCRFGPGLGCGKACCGGWVG